MVPHARERFNKNFSEERFQNFINEIHPRHDIVVDFRIAESPVFVDKEFESEMYNLFNDIKAVVSADDFSKKMDGAVPEAYRVPNEDKHPSFMAVDFAVCRGEDGKLIPQLIEMQGIASLFSYQRHVSNAFLNHFDIAENFSPFFEGISNDNYVDILKRVIIGDEDPENVILLDIKPKYQKTKIPSSVNSLHLPISAELKKIIKKLLPTNIMIKLLLFP